MFYALNCIKLLCNGTTMDTNRFMHPPLYGIIATTRQTGRKETGYTDVIYNINELRTFKEAILPYFKILF